MKKIAQILALVMLVSSLPLSAMADKETEFYTNIGFADCATYSNPADVTLKGKNYIAKVIRGGIDKMLILKNAESKLTVTAPVIPGETMYWIQIRMKFDDLYSKKTISLTMGGKKVSVLTVNPNNSISDAYGNKLTSVPHGKWVDMAFMIDSISGKGDIYIDGRMMQSRFAFGKDVVSAVVFESDISQKTSTWNIDYIRSYQSSELIDADEYKYNLNSETLPEVSLELQPYIKRQSQLIVGYDFEDDPVGESPDGFWKKNDPYIDEREDNKGKAFRIERKDVTVTTEHFIDLLVNATMSEGFIEADVYSPENENITELFILRDKPGNVSKLIFLHPDGSVKTSNGLVVAKGVNKKWTNIAVKLNFLLGTYDVYINRELVAEEISIPNSKTEDYLQLIRFQIPTGNKKGVFWMDNMFAYIGEDLMPYSEDMAKDREEARLAALEEERLNGPKGEPAKVNADFSYFNHIEDQISATPSEFLGNYDEARNAYKNAFCVLANSPNALIGGDKYSAPAPVLWEELKFLVPVRTLGAVYGFEIGWDAATGTVTLGDYTNIKEGDTSFEYKGKTIELSIPVKIVDGVMYLELVPFAQNVLNSFVYESTYGVAVVAPENFATKHCFNITGYLCGDRPNAETLYNTLTSRYPNKTHPRVLFSSEEIQGKLDLVGYDENITKWSETVMKNADFLLDSPLPAFAIDSSKRLQNLTTVNDVLNLYWAYRRTGDGKYVNNLIDRAMACCNNYTSWGHDGHYLEVGETCASMGLAFDLFYDHFTKEQRDFLASKILEYGIEPSNRRFFGNNECGGVDWPIDRNNWNIVVNKGIIAACIAIGDEYESDLCMNVLEKSLKSLEYVLPSYSPDGNWGEGPSYWSYATLNAILGIKALDSAFGTNYGLSDFPGFTDTGYYPFRMSGNDGAYAYNDAPRVMNLNWDSCIFYISQLAKDSSLAGLQLSRMNALKSNGNVSCIIYYDPKLVSDPAGMNLDSFYPSKKLVSIRSDWGSNSVWAAFQANANDLDHGHVDLGSFEYEANGVRFANEMGKDDYNLPGYWNTSVRNLYALRAEGHNVYVINPDIGAGQETKAKSKVINVASKDQGNIYTIDMTPAYINDVQHATRGFMLSEQRRVFTVQDEIEPLGNDEYYWFWHTVADIEICDDGKSVILTNSNRKVKLYFTSSVDFTIEKGLSLPLPTSPVVDGQLGDLKSTMNKITVRFKSQAGVPLTFRATAVPEGCGYVPGDEIVPIDGWSIPDGPVTLDYPTPEAILVDGVEIDGFNPDVTAYSFSVNKVLEKMPVVSVEGVENYVVHQATMDDPVAVITIPSTTHEGWYYKYYINVEVSTSLNKPSDPSLDIANVEASAIPESFNPPPDMLDKDFNTRWSAEGTQWAIFDLGEIKQVSGFGIAIYSGLSRSQKMELYVSQDGVNYTEILKGKTSKLTKEMEYIEFNPVNARYVKFVGHGNSSNQWNSITEIEIFGK